VSKRRRLLSGWRSVSGTPLPTGSPARLKSSWAPCPQGARTPEPGELVPWSSPSPHREHDVPELHLEPWPTADGTDDALSSASSAHVIARFPCVLGRATSCDEWLDDAAVSRCHCVFSWHKGRLGVEDLGSLNGTAVNGKRLAGVQPLADGDVLQVGQLAFRVRLQSCPAIFSPALPSASSVRHSFANSRSTAKQPRTCDPGSRRWSRMAASVQPASSRASASTFRRARSSSPLGRLRSS
jgi:hypothetical protein